MWICRPKIKYSSLNGTICLRSGRDLFYILHKGCATAEFFTSVLDVGWESTEQLGTMLSCSQWRPSSQLWPLRVNYFLKQRFESLRAFEASWWWGRNFHVLCNYRQNEETDRQILTAKCSFSYQHRHAARSGVYKLKKKVLQESQ